MNIHYPPKNFKEFLIYTFVAALITAFINKLPEILPKITISPTIVVTQTGYPAQIMDYLLITTLFFVTFRMKNRYDELKNYIYYLEDEIYRVRRRNL